MNTAPISLPATRRLRNLLRSTTVLLAGGLACLLSASACGAAEASVPQSWSLRAGPIKTEPGCCMRIRPLRSVASTSSRSRSMGKAEDQVMTTAIRAARSMKL